MGWRDSRFSIGLLLALRKCTTSNAHLCRWLLFALGMFIFLSLTFVGSVTAPLPIGVSSGLGATVGPFLVLGYRLVALLAGFMIAMVFAGIFYRMLSKAGPFGVDLDDVNKDPVATGIYVVGYLIFLGAILYAALLIPV